VGIIAPVEPAGDGHCLDDLAASAAPRCRRIEKERHVAAQLRAKASQLAGRQPELQSRFSPSSVAAASVEPPASPAAMEFA